MPRAVSRGVIFVDEMPRAVSLRFENCEKALCFTVFCAWAFSTEVNNAMFCGVCAPVAYKMLCFAVCALSRGKFYR